MASWHLSDILRGYSLCSMLARADSSILMNYRFQDLLKQQRQDESNTLARLAQQGLATKLMRWRKPQLSHDVATIGNTTSVDKTVSVSGSTRSTGAGRAEGVCQPDMLWNHTSSEQGESISLRIISFPLTFMEHLISKICQTFMEVDANWVPASDWTLLLYSAASFIRFCKWYITFCRLNWRWWLERWHFISGHGWLTSASRSFRHSVCTGPASTGIPPPGPKPSGAWCVRLDGGYGDGGDV